MEKSEKNADLQIYSHILLEIQWLSLLCLYNCFDVITFSSDEDRIGRINMLNLSNKSQTQHLTDE